MSKFKSCEIIFIKEYVDGDYIWFPGDKIWAEHWFAEQLVISGHARRC